MQHTSSSAKFSQRRSVALALAALAVSTPLFLGTNTAFAQAYPNKPITMIVPWPAGGSTDRHLRTLAEIAGKNLGQTIIVQIGRAHV